MKARILLSLLPLIILQIGAQQAELSWRQAAEAAAFPSDAPDGTQHHGYTLYVLQRHKDDPKPRMTGWCKVLDRGQDTVWDDRNADQKKDADESFPNPYHLYYEASANVSLDTVSALPDKDGMNPDARKEFLRETSGAGWKEVALGDLGRVKLDKGQGSNSVAVVAIRGPFRLRLSVRLYLDMKMWGISPWYEEGDDRLTYERQHHAKREEMVTRYKQRWNAIEGEALELARAMFASWDAWCARKLSDGPGVRGFYSRKIVPFLPLPSDAPRGFALDGEFPKGDYGSVRFLRKEETSTGQYEREQYIVEFFSQMQPGESGAGTDKPANQPILYAQKRLQDEIASCRKDYTGDKKRFVEPVAVRLQGADEAVRCLAEFRERDATYYSEFDFLLVRHGNLAFRVRGDHTIRGKPVPKDPRALPHTETLAKIVLARMLAGAKPAGPEASALRVTLTATPPAIWADGRSQCRIRIEARTAEGKGGQDEFSLETRSGGKLSPETVRTGYDGLGEATYTASDVPGETTIRAVGKRGSGELKIRQGGLLLKTVQPNAQALADGKTPLHLSATCIGLDGKPIANVDVRLAEVEAQVPGKIDPPSAKTGPDGVARFTYVASAFDPREKRRLGDVTVAATGSFGTPSLDFRSELRLRAYAGETAVLTVEKPGYAAGQQFPIMIPARNATIRGRAVGVGWQGASFPLAHARISVAGMKAASVQSAADGSFTLAYVGDPMSSTQPDAAAGDIAVAMDADLLNRMQEGEEALKALSGRGYDVSRPAGFLQSFPERLAHSEPGEETGALVEAMPCVAWMSLYVKLLDERHAESVNWMSESFDPVVDQLANLLDGLQDMEKAAKEKLGASFDAGPWRKFRRTAAGKLLRRLNIWYKRNTKSIRRLSGAVEGAAERGGKLGEAAGIGGEDEDGGEQSLPAAAQKLLKIAADPAGEAVGAAQGAAGVDDLTAKLKAAVAAAVKSMIRTPLETAWKERAQAALNRADGRPAQPGGAEAAARALELFTSFEQEHNRLNMANLDRELYRLDAGLFMNTVVKGVFIYAKAKNLLAGGWRSLSLDDWKKVQESVTDSAGAVDTAAAFLDGAFRIYQGQFWMQDCWRASEVLDRLQRGLVP